MALSLNQVQKKQRKKSTSTARKKSTKSKSKKKASSSSGTKIKKVAKNGKATAPRQSKGRKTKKPVKPWQKQEPHFTDRIQWSNLSALKFIESAETREEVFQQFERLKEKVRTRAENVNADSPRFEKCVYHRAKQVMDFVETMQSFLPKWPKKVLPFQWFR